MDITIPENFVQVTKDRFWEILDQVNWRRKAFANCEAYTHVSYFPKPSIAVHRNSDDTYWVEPSYQQNP